MKYQWIFFFFFFTISSFEKKKQLKTFDFHFEYTFGHIRFNIKIISLRTRIGNGSLSYCVDVCVCFIEFVCKLIQRGKKSGFELFSFGLATHHLFYGVTNIYNRKFLPENINKFQHSSLFVSFFACLIIFKFNKLNFEMNYNSNTRKYMFNFTIFKFHFFLFTWMCKCFVVVVVVAAIA